MELNRARELALGLTPPPGSERIRLEDALGRVLFGNIYADCDLPREPRSRLDGYALRSSDTLSAPVRLKIHPGEIAAGHSSSVYINPGETIRIFTGAPLPGGADAVAPQEEVSMENGLPTPTKPCAPGFGVFLPGVDMRKGRLLLPDGAILTPTRLALIASFGHEFVEVGRRPRVALLATGDEVRELGVPLDGPWCYCNNRLLLSWLTTLHGGLPLSLGTAPDDLNAIVDRLVSTDADIIVSTGGMGHGGKDFAIEAWKSLGIKTHFRGIDLTPGYMSAMGSKGERIFWGLPGNPWAARIVFEELIAPTLRRFQGCGEIERPTLAAELETTVRKKAGLHRAAPGILRSRQGSLSFAPAGNESESLFESLRDSFTYILLGPHVVEVAAGSEVQVYLNDFPLSASGHFGGAVSALRNALT